MQSGYWNKIITTALLGFAPLAAGQDPLLELLDKYSACLIEAATDDTPVAVTSATDLAPLKGECEPQMKALTALLPADYLEPILAEVEGQAVSEIASRNAAAD